jgi:ABC-type amino acid transport system permease subunit
LSGDSGSLIPALITGLIAAAVGGLWWLAYHRHARFTTWIIGAIPFLVTLFFFYTYLERLLPANY